MLIDLKASGSPCRATFHQAARLTDYRPNVGRGVSAATRPHSGRVLVDVMISLSAPLFEVGGGQVSRSVLRKN